MNVQEYLALTEELAKEEASLRARKQELKQKFISAMQSQGYAYINTEATSYGETFGISARLVSPQVLSAIGATRETIEGATNQKHNVDNFSVDWEELEEKFPNEIIFL